ncbi:MULTISPECIES: SDR family oxidoreductase [unclassified Dietzia]|uniref:SDR family oxidoreductase n=1 Tax=unclassified Dietzia TaxID=2617939 RepID=UPI000D212DB4|nr:MULTISPECIES: SDR family oxidoreductase [unclassified Dietzia]AVZ40888.1 short chain dehydrogenase [Dietzia sp. JS16-p6b]MBB1023416.1 SDR family oxidoreductase [Dietzia sp. DQ12-76]MBB1027487.1 SDR family oxidoreductase [Dietzia sp. DQ11-38-2]
MGTVMITGASRGIGAATARALDADHELILVGRDADALASVARTCRSARVVTADLTTPEGVSAVADGVATLDGVIHCAGVAELGRIDETDAAQWRRAFEINVLAVVELTRVLLPVLRAVRGHVVVINSGAGTTAKPGWGSYSASKFALRAVTDTLRGEEPALRVTSIHPGRVDTDMQRAIVAAEGGAYDPSDHLTPDSVATAVRHALDSTPDAHPTEIVVRPRRH